MSQTTQPTGNFYAPINRYKQPGDNKPIFTGTLSKPGEEAELPFALWAFEYTDSKSGEVKRGYSGSINGVAANVPPKAQIDALLTKATGGEATINNLTLRPGQIVIFENGFKDDAPDKQRPDLWGMVNPTDSSLPFRVSAWLKQYEDSKRPYLSGTTQYPQPNKTEPEMQDATPTRAAQPPSSRIKREREAR